MNCKLKNICSYTKILWQKETASSTLLSGFFDKKYVFEYTISMKQCDTVVIKPAKLPFSKRKFTFEWKEVVVDISKAKLVDFLWSSGDNPIQKEMRRSFMVEATPDQLQKYFDLHKDNIKSWMRYFNNFYLKLPGTWRKKSYQKHKMFDITYPAEEWDVNIHPKLNIKSMKKMHDTIESILVDGWESIKEVSKWVQSIPNDETKPNIILKRYYRVYIKLREMGYTHNYLWG